MAAGVVVETLNGLGVEGAERLKLKPLGAAGVAVFAPKLKPDGALDAAGVAPNEKAMIGHVSNRNLGINQQRSCQVRVGHNN